MEGRIPMLERDQVTPEVAALYDALLQQRGVVPNMFKAVANCPSLVLSFAGLLKVLLGDGALPGWYKELVAVRVSFLLKSEYAVRAHSISARKKGASEAHIQAVLKPVPGAPFTEAETLGLQCADLLHQSADAVDDDFYGKLKERFHHQQIVELIATASAFEFLPRFVDGLRIPMTPPAAASR